MAELLLTAAEILPDEELLERVLLAVQEAERAKMRHRNLLELHSVEPQNWQAMRAGRTGNRQRKRPSETFTGRSRTGIMELCVYTKRSGRTDTWK